MRVSEKLLATHFTLKISSRLRLTKFFRHDACVRDRNIDFTTIHNNSPIVSNETFRRVVSKHDTDIYRLSNNFDFVFFVLSLTWRWPICMNCYKNSNWWEMLLPFTSNEIWTKNLIFAYQSVFRKGHNMNKSPDYYSCPAATLWRSGQGKERNCLTFDCM